ncbi:MAG: rhamnan synthesis F family protein [Agrococcus sp.]
MRLESPRRALVYAFHDIEGVVDDANLTYLAALVAEAERSVVIVNGELQPTGRARIEALGATVIQRPNDGYDVWAFKTGIESLGEELSGFDELIVANSSVFGPVRALADVLREMDARDVDFWGITRHAALGTRPVKLGRTPRAERTHIQSYFTAFRRSVLASPAFAEYWRDLPPILDYADAVRAHEMVMTGYFEDAGFRWDTLVDTTELEPFSDNPLIGLAAAVLDRGCPVFKRRMLYISTEGLLAHSAGSAAQELWERLRSAPGIDLDALERHVVRTMRAEDAQRALQDFVRIDAGEAGSTAAVAAVVLPGPLAQHQLEHMAGEGVRTVVLARDRDAVPAPPGLPADVIRTGTAPAHLALSRIDAPLLYVLPSIAEPRHEADARVAHEHSSAALGWRADEVGRVAAAFEGSALLGAVLAPPSPARNFYGGIGGAMDEERRATVRSVCRALGADPAALGDTLPGGGLWIRREAAAAWSDAVDALPAELRDRAAKRLRPHDWTAIMVAVLPKLGWRVRRGLSRRLAETLVAISGAAYASINRAADAREGEGLEATLQRIDDGALSATVFFDLGPGFAHVTSRSFALRAGEPVEIRVRVPEDALGVRFDPVEGSGALVEGIAIEPDGLTIDPLNGSRSRGVDLFSSHDPAYVVGGTSAAGREIVIRAAQIVRLQADSSALELLERRFGAAGAVARARHLAMRVRSKAVRTLRRR